MPPKARRQSSSSLQVTSSARARCTFLGAIDVGLRLPESMAIVVSSRRRRVSAAAEEAENSSICPSNVEC